MKIDDTLRTRLLATIRDRLALDAHSIVNIESIEIDEERREIRIRLSIETEAPPSRIAEGYFGLTGRVKETLGERWGSYFPIITPSINVARHA